MANPKMQPTQNSANQTSEIGLWARPFSGIPLRTKLVVAFLIVALLPLSFLVYLNIRDLRQAAIENANQSLESAASQTAAEIDRFIGSNLSAVRIESKLSLWAQYLSLSASERRGSNIEAEVSSTLNDLSRKGQTYSPASVPSYGVIDQQGITAIDTLSQNIGQLNDEKDFFQSALQTGQPYVSPVIFSEPDKGAVLIFSSPIFNQANEFMGVLRIRYNAAILQEQVFQKSGLAGTETFGVLLDENNIRLADGLQPDLNFKSVIPLDSALLTELKRSGRLPNVSETELSTNLPDFEAGLANTITTPTFSAQAHPGKELEQIAVKKLDSQPWAMAFVQPRFIFLGPVDYQLGISLALVVFALFVALVLAVLFSLWLTRPVTELTVAAEQVRSGDLSAQVKVRSADEIGILAATFNNMTGQLGELVSNQQYRTQRLGIIVNVGERLSSILNFDALLSELAVQVQTRLGYYLTRVYVVDETTKNLELVATAGTSENPYEASQEHIEGNDLTKLVAQAARTGNIVSSMRRALDADKQALNPSVSNASLEIAVPIVLGGRVVAVLDVHENRSSSLDDEEANLLRSLTNQVAVTIRNARLFEEVEEALNEARNAYERYIAQSWNTDRIRSQQQRYHYAPASASSLGEAEQAAAKQAALHQNRPALVKLASSLSDDSPARPEVKPKTMAAPIMLQDLKIGTVQLHRAETGVDWTDDDLAMVEAVIDQLVQTAENLRLFEETREQAGREQTLREITDKLRASPNLEQLVATASQELNKYLPAAYLELELGLETQYGPGSNGDDHAG